MTDAERHELAEAEALAQALERDTALPDLPAEALQTAAFLRFNAKDADLGDAAAQRIFTELQGSVDRASQPKRSRLIRIGIWLAPALALGTLSVLIIQQRSSPPEIALSLPYATSAESSAAPSPLAETVATEQAALCDLAEQQLARGQPERALRTVADGLVLSAAPSVALARLYVTKAQAHERRGETLLANDSYYQALQVNQQLMQDSLGK